jgi:hypothetical protein
MHGGEVIQWAQCIVVGGDPVGTIEHIVPGM